MITSAVSVRESGKKPIALQTVRNQRVFRVPIVARRNAYNR